MSTINKVILVGNLGQDPEIRTTQDGTKIASLSLATTENWKDKQTQEWQSKTEWHRIVVFNENLTNVCENYLKKGSKIYVEGQLKTRKWTDNQNMERYTTEVVLSKVKSELRMLDSRKSGEFEQGAKIDGKSMDNTSGKSITKESETQGSVKADKEFNDEIPF